MTKYNPYAALTSLMNATACGAAYTRAFYGSFALGVLSLMRGK